MMNWRFTLLNGQSIECESYVLTDGIFYLNTESVAGGVDTWEYAIPREQVAYFKHA